MSQTLATLERIAPTPARPLLAVDGLSIEYAVRGASRPAVRDVSFTLERGEVLAVLGESGSGKTTIAQSIVGLLPRNAQVQRGAVVLDAPGGAVDLVHAPERELRGLRGTQLALVPQDPGTSLNPTSTIGASVAQALRIHRAAPRGGIDARVIELLERVGIDDPARRARQYPHELSGGMRQRALIAAAIALDPQLIVADEPTSALDVTVQRRILDLIDTLRAETGAAVLLITHDLAVAAERADRVLVLDDGVVQEVGPAAEVLRTPASPAAKRLLEHAPSLDAPNRRTPRVRPGEAGEVGQAFVQVEGLSHVYGAGRTAFRAINDVGFTIAKGTTHALVGESGSGKTTIGRAVTGFIAPTSGSITIGGRERAERMSARERRAARLRVQLVHQNPYASLDPRRTIEQTIAEPLRNSGVRDRDELRARVAAAIERVALPADAASRLPRELSGGQRQRVAIARALVVEPELVVLDEAVSALDVSVQAQILALLDELQRDLGLTYLFITHDLAVVRAIADTVTVLRKGRAIETGSVDAVIGAPQHDATKALLAAVPQPRWHERQERT